MSCCLDLFDVEEDMPFTKKGPNDYVSPSGRHFTKKQVTAYYATEGFSRPVRKAKPKKKGK